MPMMTPMRVGPPVGAGKPPQHQQPIYGPGPTNGYATPNGVTGFIGPAAGSLQKPTAWYVRAGGSNTNGGTTNSLAPSRGGADMTTVAGSFSVTAASAAFTSADVGQGIFCNDGGSKLFAKIVAVTNSTTAVLSNPAQGGGSSQAWAIGGAWATPEPVLNGAFSSANQTCGVATGDTVYIGAGTYRVVYKVGANLGATFNASGTVKDPNAYFNGQVSIVGDVTGQSTGDAGMVQLTAYTTNDKTVPSATALLNLNGKSNLAFSNIMFVGGNTTLLSAAVPTSQNISFTDCAFAALRGVVAATAAYSTQLAWLFSRCVVFPTTNVNTSAFIFTLTTGNTLGDYDANVLFTNCHFSAAVPASFFSVTNSGTLSFNGGGIRLRNATVLGGAGSTGLFTTTASRISTVFPCAIYNSLLISSAGAVALNAGTSGALVEDFNLIYAATPRTNVTAGAHSISDGSYAPLFHFGQERIWLPPLFRPFGEPMANSPLLGFGNDGAQTPYDIRGLLNPRPAGGSSAFPAVGAMERADTFVADPTPIGPNTGPIKLTGPGYNDLLLPIGVTEVGQTRTFSIEVQWDSSYATGTQGNGQVATLPAVILVGKPQMGVAQQIVVATGGSGTPQTITLASFTPTASGVLTLRLVSYDLSGASVVEWDGATVT